MTGPAVFDWLASICFFAGHFALAAFFVGAGLLATRYLEARILPRLLRGSTRFIEDKRLRKHTYLF